MSKSGQRTHSGIPWRPETLPTAFEAGSLWPGAPRAMLAGHQVLGRLLCLLFKLWDYEHAPPCPAPLMGSRD